jgi:uncharacterized membrane protein
MTSLTLAALTFTGLHLLVSGTRLRDTLVLRLGERPYRGLFSLASAVALAWLIWAYMKVKVPQVTPLLELRWLAVALMFVAFLLVVLGLFTRGPTIVGAEALLDRGHEARGIHRITRHPFLWGFALWAIVHMLFNPDPAALLFFGTFAVVACIGTFSIDAKRARLGERWSRYAATTSNLPFAAIAQGRNRLALAEIGVGRLAAAAAAFVAFTAFHARFFGLPPF